jgi:hypothetical protein
MVLLAHRKLLMVAGINVVSFNCHSGYNEWIDGLILLIYRRDCLKCMHANPWAL